jgi:hypothetical protein
MNLLGLEQSMPALLEQVERCRKAIPAQAYGANIVIVDLQEASMYVNARCRYVSLLLSRRLSNTEFTSM